MKLNFSAEKKKKQEQLYECPRLNKKVTYVCKLITLKQYCLRL